VIRNSVTMNITDRFSSHLREAMIKAIRMATELNNSSVEPIHLFFALLIQKGSVAAEILNRFKCQTKTVEQATAALERVVGKDTGAIANRAEQILLAPFSASAKLVLERSMLVAQEHQHNYIGTEHLLSALMSLQDPAVLSVLKVNNISLTDVGAQINAVLGNASQFPSITEAMDVVDNLQDHIQDSLNAALDSAPIRPMAKKNRKAEAALDFFGANLTNRETQSNIDPVVGRDNEIERTIHILCRRTKNNPVLLGDPGVGKTAIVEGLAKKIVEGQVPDLLLNKKIYALDMGLLIAGTIYRGEFEARLRQVMEDVARDPNVILFIDELHNIVGAGSNQGTMDAANILKPMLARGQLRCIGATTPQEFKKHIENDSALERRFQPVYVKESNVSDTIKILSGIRKNYESFHRLNIMDEAVEAAAKLADRYINNKFLPDKAIDLMDEAAAAKRLSIKPNSAETRHRRLAQKLEKTIQEKEEAAQNDRFDKAVKLKEEENKLRAQVEKAARSKTAAKLKMLGKVTAKDVATQLARILGTPPSDLLLEEKDRLAKLENELKQHIVGQDEVIGDISRLICQAQLGLSHPDRPLASFLFVGESGVGKTELAKTLAGVLYPGQDALIHLNMSEFSEGYGVSKILGSPAGYIGYRESNQFTDRIKMRPHCVVLFDEIDKAHKDVIRLLLQMLENGEISDSTGKKISLRHAIIILTTTLGTEEAKRASLGFGDSENAPRDIQNKIIEKTKNYFSPEIINRLDKICFFNPLSKEAFAKIAELELNQLNKRLERYHTLVKADKDILQQLINQLPERKINARDVRQKIRNDVERLISEIILRDRAKPCYRLIMEEEKLGVK